MQQRLKAIIFWTLLPFSIFGLVIVIDPEKQIEEVFAFISVLAVSAILGNLLKPYGFLGSSKNKNSLKVTFLGKLLSFFIGLTGVFIGLIGSVFILSKYQYPSMTTGWLLIILPLFLASIIRAKEISGKYPNLIHDLIRGKFKIKRHEKKNKSKKGSKKSKSQKIKKGSGEVKEEYWKEVKESWQEVKDGWQEIKKEWQQAKRERRQRAKEAWQQISKEDIAEVKKQLRIFFWGLYCLPGYIFLFIVFYFPTEWGKKRNVSRGGRQWKNRKFFAPFYSSILYFFFLLAGFSEILKYFQS